MRFVDPPLVADLPNTWPNATNAPSTVMPAPAAVMPAEAGIQWDGEIGRYTSGFPPLGLSI